MIGRVVKGKYKIYDEVGSGGFATVYLGRNMDTNEIVAIKVLSRQYTAESQYVERFRREAGMAERLRHPNIVHVLDHGIEDGIHLLVMEFVEGLTLDRLIERKGQLSIDETLSYAEQAAAGLQAAYQAGVVHRDIKPANLMVTPNGTIKIMDFGIARMEAMAGLTQSGMFMGTPRYISPEMARGAQADIRADLYALGLLIYEMLTGKPPFDAENPWAVLRQQIESDPTPIREVRPDVPPWLEAIIARAMAKDPMKRFQTPAEMLAALKEQTATPSGVYEAAPSKPATRSPYAVEAARRKGVPRGLVLGIVGAVVVIALGIGALLAFGGGGQATPTPTEAIAQGPTATARVVVVTNTPQDTPEPLPTSDEPTATLAPTTTSEPEPTDTPQPTEPPTAEPTATLASTDTPPPPTDTADVPTEAPPTNTPKPKATNTPAPTAAPTQPPASPVSGRIAFSSGGSLYVVDAATKQTLFIVPGMHQPDFRRDGQLIIAKGFRGDKTSIWTIDAKNGSFVREQSPFTDDYRPFWAPDATRFVYDSLHQGSGDSNLYWQELDRKEDNYLIHNGVAVIGRFPVWMENDLVAFNGCGYWPDGIHGKCGIWRMPSWGGRPELVKQGSQTIRPTDNYGTQLVYMEQSDGKWEVYIVPYQGGAERNLSNSSTSQDGLGTFSPDGKLVAFASNRSGNWAIWMVKPDGSGLSKLFDLPAPLTAPWDGESISWGP